MIEIPALGEVLLVEAVLPQTEPGDGEELRRLAETAGGRPVATLICRRDAPEAATFIGAGKCAELAELAATHAVKTVIFNRSLTPAQERNLEKSLQLRVMDRVALILAIFAQRARTHEGRLQVELAQLQYEQARLVRGWTHLERQKGGFGLRGGPGETQIEIDRRLLRTRIAALRGQLAAVARRRGQNRRRREARAVPEIACVGYTNAGKSTLFNRLTAATVYAADQLFATLDPTVRACRLEQVGPVVFSDTVGFIRNLPPDLVAAFRGTLEETARATLLLHVVDGADPQADAQAATVETVLDEIGAGAVPRLTVYNKCDLLADGQPQLARDATGLPTRVRISARTGAGIPLLLQAIAARLSAENCHFLVKIDETMGRLRARLYAAQAVMRERRAADDRSLLEVSCRAATAARLDRECDGALARACGGRPWARDAAPEADAPAGGPT